MILADKIMQLRKKAGWSQEELAEQLGVTRQSVSKWEGAQSLPDLEKILQMSRLFGVSTDFLLKDELEAESPDPAPDTPALRRVTLAEASAYLALRREAAPKMALATLLCVWSPVALIGLSFVSEAGRFPLTQNAAAGLGLCILLILVAIGVALFLSCGRGTRDFAFLETEPFETEYGVSGMVKERRRAGEDRAHRLTTAAVTLCILAALPLFAAAVWGAAAAYILGVCGTIVLAGIGAALFVYTGTETAAMEKLLEDGDYTRARKRSGSLRGTVSVVYWLTVTAVFLFYTFGPRGNGQPQYSWFIWAIAGVLFAAVLAIVRLLEGRKR